MSVEETEVLVIGGGPVGMSTAIELRRFGVECRVVEAQATRPDGSRALTLHARTLELLARRGEAERFIDLGQQVSTIAISTRPNRQVKLEFSRIQSTFPYVLVLPQVETERVLEEQLRELGGTVERDQRVTEVEFSDECVEVSACDSLGEKTRWRPRWVVAADGAHSTVRRLLGASTVSGREGHRYLGADVSIDRTISEIRMVWSENGFGVLVPFRDGTYRVAVSSPVTTTAGSQPSLVDVQEQADRVFPWHLGLSEPTWITSLNSGHRQLSAYRHGRVLFAGDAAHTHNPAGGQGMNIGLHDSFSLGWRLAYVTEGAADESLLDDYHRERHPAAARVLKSTERSMQLAQTRDPSLRFLRRNVFQLAPPQMRKWIAEDTAGLHDDISVRDPQSLQKP